MLYKDEDWEREFSPVETDIPGKQGWRKPWMIDLSRLIHAPCFRRLTGKTQVFPNYESDFFRNRLTHSMEVAQIAKSLAIKLNYEQLDFVKEHGVIHLDLIEFAGLAHDLGHPPFGHNGERALHKKMKEYGGFEGNAQTLRLVARLEKKEKDIEASGGNFVQLGKDYRRGLNLTYRSLASILKYDNEIIGSVKKGYYSSEKELVKKIKEHVIGPNWEGLLAESGGKAKVKTIECSIMDLADDITYSTFDLEDAFKAGFLKPTDMLTVSDEKLDRISEKVIKAMDEYFEELGESKLAKELQTVYNPIAIKLKLKEIFQESFGQYLEKFKEEIPAEDINDFQDGIRASRSLDNVLVHDGFFRTIFTSQLINKAVADLKFVPHSNLPSLSKVTLELGSKERVEILKQFVFYSVVNHPRIGIPEYRGFEIVQTIFEILDGENEKGEKQGYQLLPKDYQEIYLVYLSVYNSKDATQEEKEEAERELKRIICDFVSTMTDRYALEFYARLRGENPQTIFKPL